MNKIITTILISITFTGCAPEEPYVYNPDAGTGCDPAEPCCDERGRVRDYGEPCGTGAVVEGCHSSATNSLRVTVCDGVTVQCDITLVRERAEMECLEGYDCAGGFLCLWGDVDGSR